MNTTDARQRGWGRGEEEAKAKDGGEKGRRGKGTGKENGLLVPAQREFLLFRASLPPRGKRCLASTHARARTAFDTTIARVNRRE